MEVDWRPELFPILCTSSTNYLLITDDGTRDNIGPTLCQFFRLLHSMDCWMAVQLQDLVY